MISRKLQDIEYSSLLQIKAEIVAIKFDMFLIKKGGCVPPPLNPSLCAKTVHLPLYLLFGLFNYLK